MQYVYHIPKSHHVLHQVTGIGSILILQCNIQGKPVCLSLLKGHRLSWFWILYYPDLPSTLLISIPPYFFSDQCELLVIPCQYNVSSRSLRWKVNITTHSWSQCLCDVNLISWSLFCLLQTYDMRWLCLYFMFNQRSLRFIIQLSHIPRNKFKRSCYIHLKQ